LGIPVRGNPLRSFRTRRAPSRPRVQPHIPICHGQSCAVVAARRAAVLDVSCLRAGHRRKGTFGRLRSSKNSAGIATVPSAPTSPWTCQHSSRRIDDPGVLRRIRSALFHVSDTARRIGPACRRRQLSPCSCRRCERAVGFRFRCAHSSRSTVAWLSRFHSRCAPLHRPSSAVSSSIVGMVVLLRSRHHAAGAAASPRSWSPSRGVKMQAAGSCHRAAPLGVAAWKAKRCRIPIDRTGVSCDSRAVRGWGEDAGLCPGRASRRLPRAYVVVFDGVCRSATSATDRRAGAATPPVVPTDGHAMSIFQRFPTRVGVLEEMARNKGGLDRIDRRSTPRARMDTLGEHRADFRWLLGVMIAGFARHYWRFADCWAVMAHGFHWL